MYRYCPIQKNCRYRGPPERHFKPQAAFRKSERNDTEPMVEETSRDVRKHYAAFGDKADIVFPFIRDNNREFFGFDVLSTQLQASKELTLQGFMLVIPCEIETGIFCREPGYFGEANGKFSHGNGKSRKKREILAMRCKSSVHLGCA